jgi:SAM-dependent methyltransferase
MPHDPLDALVAEQTAYYRARAGEYDKTSAYDAVSRAALVTALEAFAPNGRVLELACGTGEWTVELVQHASQLTAVDVAPEMLALNRERVGRADVRYLRADLFAWMPPKHYDVVFFSAWLSHVPPQRFADFWALVAACLNDHGRVFLIDDLPAVAAHEQLITGAPGSRSRAAPDDRRAIPNRKGVLRARHAQSSAGRAWLGCRYTNGWLAVLLGRCKPLRHSPEQVRHSRSAQSLGRLGGRREDRCSVPFDNPACPLGSTFGHLARTKPR